MKRTIVYPNSLAGLKRAKEEYFNQKKSLNILEEKHVLPIVNELITKSNKFDIEKFINYLISKNIKLNSISLLNIKLNEISNKKESISYFKNDYKLSKLVIEEIQNQIKLVDISFKNYFDYDQRLLKLSA
jgi:hypothetical protein